MEEIAENDALLNYAVLCAMRYKWHYPGYENLDKTSLALRRKCKGTKKLQRQQLIEKALLLNEDAEKLAKALASERNKMKPDELMESKYWEKAIKDLMKQHSSFPEEAVESSLGWGFYWSVLR